MLKNMKLRGKMLIVCIWLVILAGIPGVLSLNRMRNINSTYSDLLVDYGFIQGDIGNAMLALTNSNTDVHDIVSYEDKKDLEYTMKKRDNELKKYKKYIKNIKGVLVKDETKKIYEEAIEESDKFFDESETLIKECSLLDNTSTMDYKKIERKLVDDLQPAYEKAYDSWQVLLDTMVKEGDNKSLDIDKKNTNTYIVILIITIVAVVSAIGLAIFISDKITKPLKACASRINLLARGDLKTAVPEVKEKDETGELAIALADLVENLNNIIEDERYLLSNMAEGDFDVYSRCEDSYIGDFFEILDSIRLIRSRLSETLTEIDVASEHVSVGSEQVASGAQELAQGATEQASAIEQLNATIASIAQQIKENATNAVQASEIAMNSANEVENSNKQMNEMIIAMNEITETSNKIAKIIKTIDDIAFQTNILALNAAVEAARAGEAGKGFAVVADEVRNLAGKSAEAAQNTTQLIESSINAVSNGTRIADMTAESLNAVVEATNNSTKLINEIAQASDEQARSIEEATKGLEQVSCVVQTNSATSEESAAASEELSAQASKMRGLISKFNLESVDGKKKTNKTKKSFDNDFGDFGGNIDLGDTDSMSFDSKY